MIFPALKKMFGAKPEGLMAFPVRSTHLVTEVVANHGNPVELLSSALGMEFEEFSSSLEIAWLIPVFYSFETAGIPGPWSAIGDYLTLTVGKLRDGACRAWTLQANAVTFYIVLEREDFDTLSVWICSAEHAVMEKLNAAADAQIEICEAELS